MAGSAQRVLSSRHRAIVDELVAMPDWPGAPYASSSAFRYVYDPTDDRDTTDASAVAQALGVALGSMAEPDPFPPLGPHPGTTQSDEGPSRPDPGRSVFDRRSEPVGSILAAIEESGSATLLAEESPERSTAAATPPSTEALLSMPASVAGRERAEQACRSLANGWFAEAEQLFIAETELTPTDPFGWFGAGLAARTLDPARAVDHLVRASRYLAPYDQPGAAYTTILAAAISEADDQETARLLLQAGLAKLDRPCPAISLHLARLGSDRVARVTEALAVDPMLDADLAALEFRRTGRIVADRRLDIQRDLAQVESSIAALADVDGRAPMVSGSIPGEHERLALLRLERHLWKRIGVCRKEIEASRLAVAAKARERRAKEEELEVLAAAIDLDLKPGTAIAFLKVCALIITVVIGSYVASRLLASANPGLARGINVLVWFIELAMLAATLYALYRAWWPYRRYREARNAKKALEIVEVEAAAAREEEFLACRRFGRASHEARLRIQAVRARRRSIVPRRPIFVADDLPLVDARL